MSFQKETIEEANRNSNPIYMAMRFSGFRYDTNRYSRTNAKPSCRNHGLEIVYCMVRTCSFDKHFRSTSSQSHFIHDGGLCGATEFILRQPDFTGKRVVHAQVQGIESCNLRSGTRLGFSMRRNGWQGEKFLYQSP